MSSEYDQQELFGLYTKDYPLVTAWAWLSVYLFSCDATICTYKWQSLPYDRHNIVLFFFFLHVYCFEKPCAWEGVFYIKVCLQSSCSFPTEQTLHFVQRELQHLAQHTLLMEHVAGGIVACLCDITIYLLFWILFELRWKDREKKCSLAYLNLFSFPILISDMPNNLT